MSEIIFKRLKIADRHLYYITIYVFLLQNIYVCYLVWNSITYLAYDHCLTDNYLNFGYFNYVMKKIYYLSIFTVKCLLVLWPMRNDTRINTWHTTYWLNYNLQRESLIYIFSNGWIDPKKISPCLNQVLGSMNFEIWFCIHQHQIYWKIFE